MKTWSRLFATDDCADGELVTTRSQVAVECDRVPGHVYLTLSPRVICGTGPSPGEEHLALFSLVAPPPRFLLGDHAGHRAISNV